MVSGQASARQPIITYTVETALLMRQSYGVCPKLGPHNFEALCQLMVCVSGNVCSKQSIWYRTAGSCTARPKNVTEWGRVITLDPVKTAPVLPLIILQLPGAGVSTPCLQQRHITDVCSSTSTTFSLPLASFLQADHTQSTVCAGAMLLQCMVLHAHRHCAGLNCIKPD